MKRKFNYKGFINKLLFSPGALLLLLFGLGGGIWFITEQTISKQTTTWDKTSADLSDVNLFERIRDKKSESFLKVTYEYKVNGNRYELYNEYILRPDEDSKKRIEEIKNNQKTRTVFYNRDNPDMGTFELEDVKISWGQIVIGAAAFLCLSLFAYGAIQVRYDYYYEESDRIV